MMTIQTGMDTELTTCCMALGLDDQDGGDEADIQQQDRRKHECGAVKAELARLWMVCGTPELRALRRMQRDKQRAGERPDGDRRSAPTRTSAR